MKLGFNAERLVHRPERVIEHLPENLNIDKTSKQCRYILSIGFLRPSKRVDLIINAFNQIDDVKIRFIIAGKASSDYGYGEKINKLASDNKIIERIDKRLEEEEYNSLIKNSTYLLICDERQLSSVTNGTMNEALLSGIPIIAPKNGIKLAIPIIKPSSTEYFIPNIKRIIIIKIPTTIASNI